MRSKSRVGILMFAIVGILAIALLPATPGVSAEGGGEDKKRETPQRQEQALSLLEKAGLKYSNLGSRLDQLVARFEEKETTPEDAAVGASMHLGESVAVTVYLSGSVDDVVAFLEENVGDPRNVGEDYIEAYVPVSLLGPVSEQPRVIRVREIVPSLGEFGPVTSQGVQAHLSASWNQAGYTGRGQGRYNRRPCLPYRPRFSHRLRAADACTGQSCQPDKAVLLRQPTERVRPGGAAGCAGQ